MLKLYAVDIGDGENESVIDTPEAELNFTEAIADVFGIDETDAFVIFSEALSSLNTGKKFAFYQNGKCACMFSVLA